MPIHKAKEQADLHNKRPITLANTATKLYTALLADCMQEFCTAHDILTDSQEGFRTGKGTMRQLQTVVNVLTDAKLLKQDIFALFIDFSSAFNTVYYDKNLWLTMEMLGFERQCISAVRSLYTGASTSILIDGHKTAPVHIDRGTLQGDSLSPLLFIIAIELMLRWLHTGGRGYSFASDLELAIVANAYADDLGTFSSCATHLAIQAKKYDIFSEWAGLRPNVSKRAVTGILHHYAEVDGTNNPLSRSVLTMLRSRLSGVTLNGDHPKFLHPDVEPYRYLGVELTMTLHLKFQMQAATQILQDRGKLVNSSMLAPLQKMTFIQSSIRPAITYALPICPYTTRDVQLLDNSMAAVAKKAIGISRCMPNGMVLKSRDRAGMGVISLFVDYGQLVSAHLTKSLNDEGPLGHSTRALHAWQHMTCKGQNSMSFECNAHSRALDVGMGDFSLKRQLSLIDPLGLGHICGPTTQEKLTTSSLYHDLAVHHNLFEPKEERLSKCMGKVYLLMQLGIIGMTDLMETQDGPLYMIKASTLQARYPRAQKLHLHLLHQITAYACARAETYSPGAVETCHSCADTLAILGHGTHPRFNKPLMLSKRSPSIGSMDSQIQ